MANLGQSLSVNDPLRCNRIHVVPREDLGTEILHQRDKAKGPTGPMHDPVQLRFGDRLRNNRLRLRPALDQVVAGHDDAARCALPGTPAAGPTRVRVRVELVRGFLYVKLPDHPRAAEQISTYAHKATPRSQFCVDLSRQASFVANCTSGLLGARQ